ncbi:BON domain-containing protein [Litorilinea aerophila]|uniref:BON domain-containing protein n=1 Tax=Litorilinea aerophila TaxID=1204385 RepID=A0A540VBZ3_9CHLR|nr:BON domain-containing protein [Litorilinea aerophila]MCC9077853.1 BON domain-containing protein [Litorilinea aerophila]OUC05043.1 hypothetical protein RY27_29680 [Litorilinea aerophila]
MHQYSFTIGAAVHCRDGRCGTLRKVVVDPYTHRVTDLIVEKGFLQKQDRVLPVTIVEKVEEDAIYLSIESSELSRYPEYREVEFQLPAPDWRSRQGYRSEHVVHWLTYYGIPDHPDPVVPMIRHRVPQGIRSDLEAIGRDTPVKNLDGMVGRIHHLLVDQKTWEITHLVVRRGVLPYRVVIPVDWIEYVDESGVFIRGDNEDLRQLPRYTERPAADILAELQDRFNAAVSDFSHVTATIEDGILRLRGVVADAQAKREAEQLGRSIQGVIDVENRLDTDAAIQARVVAALQSDPRTSDEVIEVINDRRVITLSGTVNSEEARRAAEEIASNQPGVIAVINALEVRPQDEVEKMFGVPAVVAPRMVPWWQN